MPNYTVTLLTTGADAPRLRLESAGKSGTRQFRVNTSTESAALSAPGVPVLGQAWDASLPDLLCRSLEARHEGGRDGPDGVGGHTRIVAEYATASGRLGPPEPAPHLRYSEAVFEVGQVTVVAPVLPGQSYVGPPLGQGAGVSVERARLVMRVHRFVPAGQAVDVAQFVALANTLNAQAVALPPLYGVGADVPFAAGQLVYRPPTITPVGALLQLTWDLPAAPNHQYAEQAVDERGYLVGQPVFYELLPRANWPAF